MRAIAIFTSLLSAAAALPSVVPRDPEANNLVARDTRILDYTIETWPNTETLYNNQSYAFFFVKPIDDINYRFSFQNSDPPNAGTINVFTVTGEGLDTIVESVGSSKAVGRDVKKTNKPFHITIDSNYP
ncbi:hypothetical protein K4K58_008480 [Colletotrichum sp. SAR11_239]|nr:hypothetical protein K4K58_008480 [Colletotrichum sp. SAR11_239]